MITDLLADLMNETDLPPSYADETQKSNEAHNCDGCGETKPDVDVWATNSETGEVLRLCESCVAW